MTSNLKSLTKAELIAKVMEQATDLAELRKQLSVQAATPPKSRSNVVAVKEHVYGSPAEALANLARLTALAQTSGSRVRFSCSGATVYARVPA